MFFDAVAAFEYMTNTFFGVGSPCQLLCSQNNINSHRKLRARWKNICDLEYIDHITGTKAKLSDDDFYEISALQSVINNMQNDTGPIESWPIDITDFSRDDFLDYLEYFVPYNPTKYDSTLSSPTTDSIYPNPKGGVTLVVEDGDIIIGERIVIAEETVKETLMLQSTILMSSSWLCCIYVTAGICKNDWASLLSP